MMGFKDILIRPVITEKSTRRVGEGNKYTFRVMKDAVKNQIKQAVERFYGVKVKNVNVSTVPGKSRRAIRTRKEFKSVNWKKAIVELTQGDKIDAFELPAEEKK